MSKGRDVLRRALLLAHGSCLRSLRLRDACWLGRGCMSAIPAARTKPNETDNKSVLKPRLDQTASRLDHIGGRGGYFPPLIRHSL
eukprot:1105173-Prymnesium_polylepis.1